MAGGDPIACDAVQLGALRRPAIGVRGGLWCCLWILLCAGPVLAAEDNVQGLYQCVFGTPDVSANLRFNLGKGGTIESARGSVKKRTHICVYTGRTDGYYNVDAQGLIVNITLSGGGGGRQYLCPMDLYYQNVLIAVAAGRGASVFQGKVGTANGTCSHQ